MYSIVPFGLHGVQSTTTPRVRICREPCLIASNQDVHRTYARSPPVSNLYCFASTRGRVVNNNNSASHDNYNGCQPRTFGLGLPFQFLKDRSGSFHGEHLLIFQVGSYLSFYINGLRLRTGLAFVGRAYSAMHMTDDRLIRQRTPEAISTSWMEFSYGMMNDCTPQNIDTTVHAEATPCQVLLYWFPGISMRARRRNLERQKPSGGPVIHDALVYGAIRTVSLAISCRDL